MDQKKLREELVLVRGEILYAEDSLSRLRVREKELLGLIVFDRERCQVCFGRGKVVVVAVGGGKDCEVWCGNCGGTGTWVAPV